MRPARRSRSAASSAVDGHIGLKLYHWSGAAATARGERVGDGLGGALEVGWVEDGTSIGLDHAPWNVSSGSRRTEIGTISDPVLRRVSRVHG